jgi:hypothetical protein
LSHEQTVIMIYGLKKVPEELRRLAVIGIIAGVVAIAVIYSRGERIAPEDVWLGAMQAFQQPKDRQQAEGWFAPTLPKDRQQAEGWFAPTLPKDRQQAEGWFTPTPRRGIAEIKAAEIENSITLPRSRPTRPGFYYELVRAQGDGEGEYVLVERKCIPKVDMPEQCYLPERGRQNFPLRRE